MIIFLVPFQLAQYIEKSSNNTFDLLGFLFMSDFSYRWSQCLYETYFQATHSDCILLFLCTFCCILILVKHFIIEYTNDERPPPGIYTPSEAQKHKVGALKLFASCYNVHVIEHCQQWGWGVLKAENHLFVGDSNCSNFYC